MDEVRITVVGAGIIGSLFSALMQELPDARLVAIVDTDKEKLKEAGERFSVATYEDTARALDSTSTDSVVICTPEDAHLGPVTEAARRGLQIFLEKPIASNLKDAMQIARIARDAGVGLMVGHCLRFDPRFNAAKRSVDAGDIGRVVHIRAWRETSISNGLLYGLRTSLSLYIGVHDIDMMHWITGSRITRAFAYGGKGRLSSLESDDSLFSVLEFENGAIASLCNSWALPQTQGVQRSTVRDKGFEVLGTSGILDLQAENIGVRVQSEQSIEYPDILFAPWILGERPGIYRNQLAHFVRMVKGEVAPAVGPEDAIDAVSVALAIDESRAKGAPVEINYPKESWYAG